MIQVQDEVSELEHYTSAAQIVIHELGRHPDEDLLVKAIFNNISHCCKILMPQQLFPGTGTPTPNFIFVHNMQIRIYIKEIFDPQHACQAWYIEISQGAFIRAPLLNKFHVFCQDKFQKVREGTNMEKNHETFI